MYSLLDVDSQRKPSSYKWKVGIVLISGSCLVLLSITAMSASSPTAESSSLFAMRTLQGTSPVLPISQAVRNPSIPWKELTLAAIADNNRCSRDVSMPALNAVKASMSSSDQAVVSRAEGAAVANAKSLLKAGVVPPLDFFDPAGFTETASEGKLLFFREAELKHGRVCMLAFLGMAVGENFHPLFGGNIDIPAWKHFALTGGDFYWVAAYLQFIVGVGLIEKATAFPIMDGQSMASVVGPRDNPEAFAVKGGRTPGDIGFDPLGMKPKTEKDLLELQNKELLNGRLAMIAVIGALSQEAVTGEKVFR